MTENKVDQHEMWKQGCRAVFAGFVASAHERGLPPTIDIFWLTEQKDTILPSLRSLVPANTYIKDGDMAENRALHNLLSGPVNKLTRCKEVDELEITVRWRELEWSLTKEGRQMFPKIIPPANAIETPHEDK